MHEFGHALTAKHYDYAVQYIMLHALGGTAVISDRIDFKTFFKHQFWITLNGPLVNVALAGIFYTIFQLSHFKLFASLVAINVVLFIFNLIPVFPMDGGRIFRSGIYFILKLFRGNRPTVMKTLKITNYVSWTTMILVISYGIYHQMPSLLIIMVFCFLAGKQEFKRLVFELGKNYNYVRF
jgi:Zn-dependent protease